MIHRIFDRTPSDADLEYYRSFADELDFWVEQFGLKEWRITLTHNNQACHLLYDLNLNCNRKEVIIEINRDVADSHLDYKAAAIEAVCALLTSPMRTEFDNLDPSEEASDAYGRHRTELIYRLTDTLLQLRN
jgi:hypothetical protein